MLSELKDADFITKYLVYTSGGEVPTSFNRWACIVGIGAWAMQDIWIEHNNSKLYPNMYAMLLGAAGTRKSTAIKGMRKLLEEAGYSYFASEKTSKEKFLEDLASQSSTVSDRAEKFTEILFGQLGSDLGTTPCWIAADEFNDFFANNILEFLSTLGVLWDKTGIYETRTKSMASLKIPNPNISILGGNTIETFSKSFPPEAIGQGFFSRILYIYAEPNGVKIAFPEPYNPEDTAHLVAELSRMRECFQGKIEIEPDAKKALEVIYKSFRGVDDGRFDSYNNRRFNHLIKLALIHCAASFSTVMTFEHVVKAHTVLVQAETQMPQALGEYGAAKNSAVTHRVLKIIQGAHKPLELGEIWKQIPGALDKITDLSDVIKNLMVADKVIITNEGFLPKRKVQEETVSKYLDWDYLTDEERRLR